MAIWPREPRGMWEMILLQKGLVTTHALLNLGLPYAVRTVWIDGALVAATGAAYVLCRRWFTWRPRTGTAAG